MNRPIAARALGDAQLAALETETRPARRERPIIVRSDEVLGLLDGTITQLWRPVRPGPREHHWEGLPGYHRSLNLLHTSRGLMARFGHHHHGSEDGVQWMSSPFGASGCRLWCRETWAPRVDDEEAAWRWNIDPDKGPKPHVFYRADGARPDLWIHRWRSPVSMPRWACRAVVEVTGLDMRRVSTATNADAEAAGFRDGHGADERGAFATSALGNFQADWSKRYPGAEWAWVATVRRVDAEAAVR